MNPGMSSAAQILYEDGQHCMCSVGNTIVSHSLSEPTVPYFSECMRVEHAMRGRYPKVVFFVAIRNDAPPPSEEARKIINGYFSRSAEHIGAVVLVVEGEGFLAAAKRSALSMIGFTSRYKFPFKVTGTVEAGIRTVESKQLFLDCGPSDIIGAVNQLKRHLQLAKAQAPT